MAWRPILVKDDNEKEKAKVLAMVAHRQVRGARGRRNGEQGTALVKKSSGVVEAWPLLGFGPDRSWPWHEGEPRVGLMERGHGEGELRGRAAMAWLR